MPYIIDRGDDEWVNVVKLCEIFDKHYQRTVWDVSGQVLIKGNVIIGHGSRIVVGKNGVNLKELRLNYKEKLPDRYTGGM